MEKKDFLFFALAIIIVLFMAVVVKPVLNGEEIQITSLFDDKKPVMPEIPTPPPTPIYITQTPDIQQTPKPVATWDGSVKEVQFVDPSTYDIPPEPVNPAMISGIPNDTVVRTEKMVSYATVIGHYDGTTGLVDIPFPSWKMKIQYTPLTDSPDVRPWLNIQVMDAGNPNSEIYAFESAKEFPPGEDKPYSHMFYEGDSSYYFIIETNFIKSYTIEIMVPEKYKPQA